MYESSAQSSQSLDPASTSSAPAPGKTTLTSGLPAGNPPAGSSTVPPELLSLAGLPVSDGGGYTFVLEPDGSFTIIAVPPGHDSALGKSIRPDDPNPNLARAWKTLAGKMLAEHPEARAPSEGDQAGGAGADGAEAAADDGAAGGWSLDGLLEGLSAVGDAVAGAVASAGDFVSDLLTGISDGIGGLLDAVWPPTPADGSAGGTPDGDAGQPDAGTPSKGTPAPGDATGGEPGEAPTSDPGAAPGAAPGGSASSTDVRICVSGDARLRDETGAELVPRQLVPQGYVLVLETSGSLVRVAQADSATSTSGTELGWTSESNLAALCRPARPSSASAQMSALLSQAQAGAGAMQGLCYRYVKGYIKDCGGYGDILDIYSDERFAGYQNSAVDFAAAVQAHGAAALGLREIGGLPMDAAPGTLLVTRGNGKINLSEEHGDIAVIQGVSGGCVICINDGTMKLVADPEAWTSGDYVGVLVGMYQPIDRA